MARRGVLPVTAKYGTALELTMLLPPVLTTSPVFGKSGAATLVFRIGEALDWVCPEKEKKKIG